MTALLLLAGCLGTEDVEDVVEDVLEVVGCGDETALNYVANATNATDDLCVHENSLETAIVDFITMIEDGPDMETLDTTVGYSMEMSEVYPDVSAHYMETTVMSPSGFKSTMEHTIDGITESSEIIISGNEIQFHIKNSTDDYTVRMKHAETFEDAMEMMMSDDEDDGMSDDGTDWEPYYGGYCEWEGNPDDDDRWSCKVDESDSDWENWWYYCELHEGDWFCTDDYDQSSDYANSADNDRYTNGYDGGDEMDEMEEMDEMADFGEVDVNDYTQYFDPLSATITGFAPDETGFTFSGSLNIDDAPFSYLEIHTDSDFNVLGFTMEDTEEEDNWVEFMMIESGDTSTDDTIALSALPYVLFDMSDDGGDDGGSDDEFMCDNGDTIPWDWVNDGYPDCEDGSDEWDDGPGEEEFHFYDNCTDDNGTYECWMDEWDYDNDGEFDESHGFDYADCSLESNGSWKCFIGYDDEEGEEEIAVYYCTPFVAQNSAGFSIFNDTNLDASLCGMEVTDEMYEFDNTTFTMPTNLIWEDCWTEGNETVCEQGEIYYDVSTTMLWETTHENNYMDCDGDYDNNTSMCTEWIGNITDADGGAFLIASGWSETVIMYQYDEATQSGLVISVESDGGDDFDPEMWFNMFDADEDGEVTPSEWADMMNQSGEGMTEDDWNGLLMMFEMFDEDNSSGLNLSEFVNMMENMDDMGDDDDDMDPETMFNMLDGNGDGEVTASEWSDFSNSTDEPMTEDDFNFLAGMMDNYDHDDSGGLDFDEFMTFMSEMEDMEDGDEGDVKMYMVFGVLPYGADIDDYHVELAMCDGTSLADIECDDSIYSVALSEVMVESEEAAMMAMMTESIAFVDSDESGTLTSGDFVMINNDTLEVDDEWNFARLYSAEADSYSDENPMMSMLPGFTGFIATIGLLGAALIRRE